MQIKGVRGCYLVNIRAHLGELRVFRIRRQQEATSLWFTNEGSQRFIIR